MLGIDTKNLDKFISHEGVVARTILNNITDSFGRGFLLAELMHPKMMKEKMHDTVKHTNAKFGWGSRTGKNCPIGTVRAERDRQTAGFLVCWFKECGKGRIF